MPKPRHMSWGQGLSCWSLNKAGREGLRGVPDTHLRSDPAQRKALVLEGDVGRLPGAQVELRSTAARQGKHVLL